MSVRSKVAELLALRDSVSESAVSIDKFTDEEAVRGKSRLCTWERAISYLLPYSSWCFFHPKIINQATISLSLLPLPPPQGPALYKPLLSRPLDVLSKACNSRP